MTSLFLKRFISDHFFHIEIFSIPSTEKFVKFTAAFALFMLFNLNSLYAATLIVNSMDDSDISGDQLCSLREAIENANTDGETTAGDCNKGSADDIIDLTNISGTIQLKEQLLLTSTVKLIGASASSLTLDGNQTVRVLQVNRDAVVEIENLTIANGRAYAGGGIRNHGDLNLLNSVITYNSAINGGGIFNEGTLTIISSTLSYNSAIVFSTYPPDQGNGGAIRNNHYAYIKDSILSNNSAGQAGGGVYNQNESIFVNSQLFKNSAQVEGSGVYNNWNDTLGTLHLEGTTIYDNEGDDCASTGQIFLDDESHIDDDSCEVIPVEPPPTHEEESFLLINLEKFKVSLAKQHALLIWKTATENNSQGFIIWRAQPALGKTCQQTLPEEYTDIFQLTFQVALGNKMQGHTYHYKDTKVIAGNTYCYLLQDIDLDGETEEHWQFLTSLIIP